MELTDSAKFAKLFLDSSAVQENLLLKAICKENIRLREYTFKRI